MPRTPTLLAVLVLAGCGARGSVPSGEDVDAGLRAAAGSQTPFYFAGDEIAGHELTAVRVDGDRATFLYGTCELPAGEGGCSPPVQIQNFPVDPAAWRAAAGCRPQRSVLDVPTARHDGLVLFTGDAVVKIYAPTSADEAAVARSLRPVDRPLDELDALPAPSAAARAAYDRGCG